MTTATDTKTRDLKERQQRSLATPTDLGPQATRDIAAAMNAILREAHTVCEEHRDVATTSLIEVWIDETERRAWFLFEAIGRGDSSGH